MESQGIKAGDTVRLKGSSKSSPLMTVEKLADSRATVKFWNINKKGGVANLETHNVEVVALEKEAYKPIKQRRFLINWASFSLIPSVLLQGDKR